MASGLLALTRLDDADRAVVLPAEADVESAPIVR